MTQHFFAPADFQYAFYSRKSSKGPGAMSSQSFFPGSSRVVFFFSFWNFFFRWQTWTDWDRREVLNDRKWVAEVVTVGWLIRWALTCIIWAFLSQPSGPHTSEDASEQFRVTLEGKREKVLPWLLLVFALISMQINSWSRILSFHLLMFSISRFADE